MTVPARSGSHLLAALIGGAVVAGALLATGVIGDPHTSTIVEEAPVAAQAPAGPSSGLTAHDIYQRNAPGVVFVRARVLEPVSNSFDLFQTAGGDTSTGSGFLVDHHGDILTNYHLIDGADRSGGVTVEFEGGATRPAAVVAVDPDDDLAVLRVDTAHLGPIAPLALGDSTSVRVGDPALAIGNPFGLDRTLTSGIVSALTHQLHGADGRTINNVIQTDLPLAPGNSGGPLLDAQGRVIGVNSQIATAGGADGSAQRVAFAIPVDTADSVLAGVDHVHALHVAYLGAGAAPTRLTHPHATVGVLDPAGPAAAAGLRRGDTIERVDGIPVQSISDVLALVSTLSPGKVVSLRVRRDGRDRTLEVTLGSHTVPIPTS